MTYQLNKFATQKDLSQNLSKNIKKYLGICIIGTCVFGLSVTAIQKLQLMFVSVIVY